MHLVYPENFAFCFQFLLDITVIPREILNIEKNVDANFFFCFWGGGGSNKVHYGLCENGESVDFHNNIIMHLLDFEVPSTKP